MQGSEAEQHRPGAPPAPPAESDGAARDEHRGAGHAGDGASGQPAGDGAADAGATDGAGLTGRTGHDAAARLPADLVDPQDGVSTGDRGWHPTDAHLLPGQERSGEAGHPAAAGTRAQDDPASVVPDAQALGRTELLTSVTMGTAEELGHDAASAPPSGDSHGSEPAALDMLAEHHQATPHAASWPGHDGTGATSATAAASPLGATEPNGPALPQDRATDPVDTFRDHTPSPRAMEPGNQALSTLRPENDAADAKAAK